jgi:hypothetical protein
MIYKNSEWIPFSKLPGDYQEVAFLKSTGTSGAFIDTKYIPNANTEFYIDFSAVHTDWGWPFGVNDNNTLFGFQLFGSINVFLCASTKASSVQFIANQRYEMEYKDGEFYVDGIKKFDYTIGQTNMSRNIYLFVLNDSGAKQGTPTTLYRFRISENGKVLHDFVPCYRKADSVAGLYDIEGGEFFTNAGTGTFVVGGDV